MGDVTSPGKPSVIKLSRVSRWRGISYDIWKWNTLSDLGVPVTDILISHLSSDFTWAPRVEDRDPRLVQVTRVVQSIRVVRNLTFHLPCTHYSVFYSHGEPWARVCLPGSTIPPTPRNLP